VTPDEAITDGHRADQRAIQERAPEAIHTVTGWHRAPGHPTTQPIECSHVPVKDRLRPMRGLQSVATGQWLAEGLTRARRVVATFHLAGELRRAS
jgi:hypothetical protein